METQGGGLGPKMDLDGWKDVNGTDVVFKTGPQVTCSCLFGGRT